MLTDSVSQFETSGVNDIPKSFQKLISEIQNVKKYKKQPKNLPLNIKTVQKNTKKPTTIKRKRPAKQSKPPKDKVHVEISSDDELYFSKNTEPTSNQTNITQYFSTLKRNSSNRNNNPKESKKQDVSYPDEEIIFSDDEFIYSNRNAITHFNGNQNPASEFQNPDYLNSLSSRNCDLNATIDLRNDFENTAESGQFCNKARAQPSANSNWKTFSELNRNTTITDCDFDIDRKKNTAPSILYSHHKSNSKPSIKASKAIDKPGSILKRNQNNDMITNNNNRRTKDISNYLLNMLKGDQEKITDLLNQVKSMNNVISKTTHDISKFFTNRNRITTRHP